MHATPPADKPTAGAGPEPGPDADATEIQADIERTRAELGETAEALATRLDVPRQVHEKVEQTKQRVSAKTSPARENAVPIAVAAGAVVLLMVVRRRRRRGRQSPQS